MPTQEQRPPVLPVLQRIQRIFGYLPRAELERYADSAAIPLYQIHAVASFYPHFRLAPPPELTIRVCRDMSCHLAGAASILAEVSQSAGHGVEVESVSCLGRCDRAPASCASVHARGADGAPARSEAAGAGHERYYLNCSAAFLMQVIEAHRTPRGALPDADSDAGQEDRSDAWAINPYRGSASNFAAAGKAVEARDAAIARAIVALRGTNRWSREQTEQFRLGAVSGLRDNGDVPEFVRTAVLDWQVENDWAKGPDLGGWSDAILAELDEARADLRGMGGAGVPASQKWRDVRDAVRAARRRGDDDRAFIIVNGDESEPGTFKDRELMLRAAHLVVEGVLLAALATDASEGFIFIRHEYPEQVAACEAAIRAAEKAGLCGATAATLGRPFPLSVFVSPGGYICGEQSALVEAMSDRRAEPRNMPPKLETNGLNDRPTLVSNVETFAWTPYVWLKGGKQYAALGVNGWGGRRFFAVSGDVRRPGVYEVPIGLTLRELIHGDKYCRGVARGAAIKAVAPSGPSGGFLPPRLTAASGLPRGYQRHPLWRALSERRGFDPGATDLDILDLELELDLFRALSPTQSLGAGIVVYAEGRDMAEQAVNALQFFRNESCGKCVPCRIGTDKLATLGTNLLAGRVRSSDWAELLPVVRDLGDVMNLTSICGLGRAAPLPLQSVTDFFGDDLAAHVAPASCAAAGEPRVPLSIGGRNRE